MPIQKYDSLKDDTPEFIKASMKNRIKCPICKVDQTERGILMHIEVVHKVNVVRNMVGPFNVGCAVCDEAFDGPFTLLEHFKEVGFEAHVKQAAVEFALRGG